MLLNYHTTTDVLHVGCEKPRAYYIPHSAVTKEQDLKRSASDRFLTLCGTWDFRFYPAVYLVDDPATEDLSCETDEIEVPRSWQTLLGRGYDTPHYTNVEYPFVVDPPHVPADNPCGLYRRTFSVTADMLEKDVMLNLEGVDSCFYLYINGAFVGYSQVSHMTSEFNITSYLCEGDNEIRVLVLKWCDGSYLEDQDKYRLSGIFREVYLLLREKTRVEDIFVRTSYDHESGDGELCIAITHTSPTDTSYLLIDPDGNTVVEGSLAAGEGEISLPVAKVQPWSDEVPTLYTLWLLCAGECIPVSVGFRTLVVRDRVVYLNGKNITGQTNFFFYAPIESALLSINGEGTVTTSTGYVSMVTSGGTFVVNGGTFNLGNTNEKGHFYTQNSGKTIINGGTFISNDANTPILYCINGFIEINGGFFQNTANSKQALLSMGNNINYANNQKITLSGGTFVNWNPMDSAFAQAWTNPDVPALIVLADGYQMISEAQANGDVWYSVVPVQ
jgi:hypothetical protein